MSDSEKVIFVAESGFALSGIEDYKLEDKCLHLTNLGNIYISKVDCLKEAEQDHLEYSYTESKIKLKAEVDGDNINIVSPSINFYVSEDGQTSNIFTNLLMVLDMEEFAQINDGLDEMIFDFEDKSAIVTIDSREAYAGTFERADKRFVFNSWDKRFEFSYKDIEAYCLDEDRLTIKGYFYSDRESKVSRKISFITKRINDFIPSNFDELVNENFKLGFLPKNDPIVFCKVSGIMNSNDYLQKHMYLIRHEDLFVMYEKKSKKEVICKSIHEFTKLDIGDGYYIVYDGQDVYNIYLNDKNAQEIGFDRIKPVSNEYIGYTKEYRPFFIKVDQDRIGIYKSYDKCVLDIEKNLVSDISVIDDKDSDIDFYVETQIKYKDKYIVINIRKSLLKDLSEEIFSEYQRTLLDSVGMDEVYENWIKSISDMIVFNFYGHIYAMNSKYQYMVDRDITSVDKINFINDLYLDLHDRLESIDLTSVYMAEILETNELNYFRSLRKSCDLSQIERLERLFFEIRNDIKEDIFEIIKCMENVNQLFLPLEMRKSVAKRMKESELYQLDFYCDLSYKKLSHLIYNLLPHYVSRTVKKVFEIYENIYSNYMTLDEDEVKLEMMDRIKSAHVFRQFSVDKDSKILRKDVIDDLYSLMKFGKMKVDSDFYYTGGYR